MQDNWLDGVFFDSKSFDLDDYNKTLYNSLKKVISGLSESKLSKLFNGLNNTGAIMDYISKGGDVVGSVFDAYQKYLIAQAIYESNAELLAMLQTTADNKMTGNASALLSDALEPYWTAFNCDNALSAVIVIMGKDGFLETGSDAIYSFLVQGTLREFVYGTISAITGIAAGALVEAADGGCPWNIGTITTDGYWDAGVIWTLYFEIIADLGEEGTPITAVTVAAQDCVDAEKQVSVDYVNGSVAHPYVAPPVEPSKPVEPNKPESKPESKPVEPSVDDNDEPVVDEPVVEEDVTVNDVTVTDTDMPKTGDASSVAIAAGLCAVAAAAFVITKKVND
jgi:LPXTG-motif cell wall-anchored protein